jgi:hypothetical protein
MDREAALSRIAVVLEPYLGATMATASTRAHCEKLGIAPGPMSGEQMESLLAKLQAGLAVFVGRDKVARLLAEIRAALGSAQASRP